MSKRLIGLMMALVVMLGCVPVSASGSMTIQEIVDQVVVPLALANDRGGAGFSRYFSYEDLAEIVRVFEENGFVLPENDVVMQFVTSGYGVPEGLVAERYCQQFFGPFGTWTDEQQGWYDDLEVRLGHAETFGSHVPGKDNMTREEAVAWALKKIREEYGEDLPLEDPDIWQMTVMFTKDAPFDSDSHHEDMWSIFLTPKNLEHARYGATFVDRDPENSTELYSLFLNPEEPFTLNQLRNIFDIVYGVNKNWPQSAWQAYSDMLQKAELDPSDYDYTDNLAFRMTGYPEPKADEISREEAIRIAKEALANERAAYNSAVLTEYEGERTWLVSFLIEFPFFSSVDEDEESGDYVVSIDSVTGEVRSLRMERSYNPSFCYAPEKVYTEIQEMLPKEEDLLPLAVEAVRKKYPEAGDPLDKDNYSIFTFLRGKVYVSFKTRNVQHSNITVSFTPEGKAENVRMDPPTDGDNLYSRYYQFYGPMGSWKQIVWVLLERDMKDLEPKEIEGKVLKATHYPEEDTVSIKHEEARELARKTTGKQFTEINSCVLVDAKPHPVWIVQLLSGGVLSLAGIDAETGETVLSMPDRADFSPRYMSFSLPEIWRKIEMEEKGPRYMAQAAIIDRVFPADVEWRGYDLGDVNVTWMDYCYMNEGTAWRMEVDGLTVRCISHREGVKSYEVEFDQEGNVIRFEEKD